MIGILYYIAAVFVLITLIISSLWLISSSISWIYGIPFVETRRKDFIEILRHVKFHKNDIFIDIGSGIGQNVFYVAKKYNVKSICIEPNIMLYAFSLFLKRYQHSSLSNFVRIRGEDISYKPYSIIYLFLFPKLIDKLVPKFLSECRNGTIIISHGFRLNKLKSKEYFHIKKKPFSTYFYKI